MSSFPVKTEDNFYIQIPLIDDSSYFFSIIIEGIFYRLQVDYNSRFDFYTLSIFDNEDNTIIVGVKLMLNQEIVYRYKLANFPAGALIIQTLNLSQLRVGFGSFDNNSVTAVYVSAREVIYQQAVADYNANNPDNQITSFDELEDAAV